MLFSTTRHSRMTDRPRRKCCCIPACPWGPRIEKEGTTRTYFAILRPDLARSTEEKNHRENLRRVILSLRDPTRSGDSIKHQLHKESASICDIHFNVHDIQLLGRCKRLRIGALPMYYLPKAVNLHDPHNHPATRAERRLKVRRRCLDGSWKLMSSKDSGKTETQATDSARQTDHKICNRAYENTISFPFYHYKKNVWSRGVGTPPVVSRDYCCQVGKSFIKGDNE